MNRVLFVLKRKQDYNIYLDSHIGVSTGLYNSAKFVSDMLVDMHVDTKLEVLADHNAIDREVFLYKPSHVIVEALWVTPKKINELIRLHPEVKWIVRIHSEMPFMAGEGIAMEWIGDYSKHDNVYFGINSPRMMSEIESYLEHINSWSKKLSSKKIIYLPNYYPAELTRKIKKYTNKEHIDVGCFGAVRPLKNHLLQAHAALSFANSIGKKLHFHVNGGRIEMKGDSVYNNLKGLFQHLWDSGHRLISHPWRPREEFLKLCEKMDIGMQCNFSETFNIVGADLITSGVPLVGSREIPWLKTGRCNPADSADMIQGLKNAHKYRSINVHANMLGLKMYSKKTKSIWYNQFKEK
jgi:hypothetical protein